MERIKWDIQYLCGDNEILCTKIIRALTPGKSIYQFLSDICNDI